MDARIAIIAITTSSSMRVNGDFFIVETILVTYFVKINKLPLIIAHFSEKATSFQH
jgi:hypothetical protein